ncbi:MAG: tetratricopeptide repeat protein [Candidatus Peribacteria bacterium]|jgi:hypothetical protein|nr:tetratricopeptide repeat protein [Candidatus Peribacteria bacterium]
MKKQNFNSVFIAVLAIVMCSLSVCSCGSHGDALPKEEESLTYLQKIDRFCTLVSQEKYQEAEDFFDKQSLIWEERNASMIDSLRGVCIRKVDSLHFQQAYQLYVQGEYDEAICTLPTYYYRNHFHEDSFLRERDALWKELSLILYKQRVAELENPEEFAKFSYHDCGQQIWYVYIDDAMLLVESGYKNKLLEELRDSSFALAFTKSIRHMRTSTIGYFIENDDFSIVQLCLKSLTSPEDFVHFESCCDEEILKNVKYYEFWGAKLH